MARPKSDIEPRILHAARKRFLDDGVDAASLRHIARDAGTSIGMIYYYFPTKDDLFLAVIEEVYEKLLADLEQALAPEGSTRDRMRRVYRRIAHATDDEVEILRLVAREGMVSSARRDRIIERVQRGHVPLALRALGQGVVSGEVRRDVHPLVLMMAMFALAGPPQIMRRVIGDRLPVPGAPAGEDLADLLVDVLFDGIRGDAGTSGGTGGGNG
jgi:AcrR family transcriptional regulator